MLKKWSALNHLTGAFQTFAAEVLEKGEVVSMNALTVWIKQHQVAAFFMIAYGITWPLSMLVFFIFPGNQTVMVSMLFAVFSPALAAMLISAIVEPLPKRTGTRRRWAAFGGSWLVSWIVMTLYYWQILELEFTVAAVLWAVFACLPAWVLSSAFASTPGVQKHFSTILRPRGNIIWYLAAFFFVPALALLGAGLTRLLGGDVLYRMPGTSPGKTALFFLLTFLSGFLCSGGINEESGWRGFALSRLQARYPVIVSIAIVWFFWALWHIPYDIGQHVDVIWMLLNRTLFTFIFSVLFAWVYNRTKGSILAPAIFHASMNTFGNNLPFTTASVVLYAAVAIFAILHERMWKKLPAASPAVYAAPQPLGQPGSEAAAIQTTG